MREVVSSLWIGESLGILERLAITSFLRQGHEFHLYCYGDVSGVPPEAAIKDANEILPASSIFRFERGAAKGSPAGFANLFRYKLLLEKGGWWVDTDTVCLKPFDFPGEVVIGWEHAPGGGKRANNGVMKMPAGHSIACQCYEQARSRNPRQLGWAQTGPVLLHSVLEEQGFAHLLQDAAVFYPIPWWKWELLLSEDSATCRFYITRATRAIHLWHEMWRRAGRDRDQSFPARCVFSELLKSHGLSPGEPRRGEETLPAAPPRAEMPVTVREPRSPEGEKKRRPDISCIVTLHAEGLLAHRTLRSVQRAIDYCAKRGVSVEKVFVLDDATDATKEVALRFAPDVSVETTVRDLGLARNEGTWRASGEFVVFQDADDLVSENWLYAACKRLRELPYEAALHPAMLVSFGREDTYWRVPSQDDPRLIIGNLLLDNWWPPRVFTRRSVALEVPYSAAGIQSGFGYEDWHWNTLAIAKGIKHEIVPLTAHFVRLRQESLYLAYARRGAVIRKSPFFDHVQFFQSAEAAPVIPSSGADRNDISPAVQAVPKPPLSLRIKFNIKMALYHWAKAFHYSTIRLFVKLDPFGLGKPVRAQSYRIRDSLLGPFAPPASAAPLPLPAQNPPLRIRIKSNIKLALYYWAKAFHYSTVRLLVKLNPLGLDVPLSTLSGRVRDALLRPITPPPAPAAAPPPALPPPLPQWVLDELRRQSDIEPELFPGREFIGRLHEWKGLAFSPGRKEVAAYGEALEALGGERFTHIFLLPWLLRGDADLESLHFVRAIACDFKKKALLITTEDVDSPWLKGLPPEVRLLEFGKIARGLSLEEQRPVLLRLLLQLEPRVIHNMNSHLGWLIFSVHGQCFKETSTLYASLVRGAPFEEGKPAGYARSFLFESWPHLKGIISDNRWYPGLLCRTYGFEERKFRTVYPPAPPVTKAGHARGGNAFKVLWASRPDKEMRPDLLLEVARRLPDVELSLYGLPAPASSGILSGLKSCPNVTLHRSDDGFESLSLTEFALFVHTSAWDGLPNVILQAMAAGLPVVASSVGGVPEVVTDQTGYLIEPPDDVAQFCAAIRRIRQSPEEASRKVENAKKLLSERHTWARFVQSVAAIEGYLGETAPVRPHAAALEAVSPPQQTA